jgi:hypothetical protein
MEAKTNGRVQRSAAEWQQILSRFSESGRSRAAFCRAEGIAPATFDPVARKLGAKKAGGCGRSIMLCAATGVSWNQTKRPAPEECCQSV